MVVGYCESVPVTVPVGRMLVGATAVVPCLPLASLVVGVVVGASVTGDAGAEDTPLCAVVAVLSPLEGTTVLAPEDTPPWADVESAVSAALVAGRTPDMLACPEGTEVLTPVVADVTLLPAPMTGIVVPVDNGMLVATLVPTEAVSAAEEAAEDNAEEAVATTDEAPEAPDSAEDTPVVCADEAAVVIGMGMTAVPEVEDVYEVTGGAVSEGELAGAD